MEKNNVNLVVHGFTKKDPKFFLLCAFFEVTAQDIVDFVNSISENCDEIYVKISEVNKK